MTKSQFPIPPLLQPYYFGSTLFLDRVPQHLKNDVIKAWASFVLLVSSHRHRARMRGAHEIS
jgi:hypothetical protein